MKKIYQLQINPVILSLLLSSGILFAQNYLPGQVIVDPDHPQWLKYNEGGPFFMSGPGDPEGFLYRGLRNLDGTRNGDQMTLINKMIGTDANCIYLMAVRSHGGDGEPDENPFVDSDPINDLDSDILEQWETWFTEMDNNGIVIYFFLYDDRAQIWSGDNVDPNELHFIQTLVDSFEHHKHLIWCVAEEYSEAYSITRVSNIAAAIRAADDHDHVIAVHHPDGLIFDFPNDPNIDQFAIQYNVDSALVLHSGMVYAWNNSAGRYNLNMSETHNHGADSTMRLKNWACAMGGSYVMVLGMDIAGTSVADLESCGYLRKFFEQTDFNEMSPHDELKFGETKYVLALPDTSYLLYSDTLGDIGIQGLGASTYNLLWFDPVNGNQELITNVNLSAGDHLFTRPLLIGDEVVLYIRRAPVLVEAKIFLEGPYNSSTGEMTTNLNTNGYIPETSPYSEDPRPASLPIPPDITDWVLVQLRETPSGPAVASRSAFLRKDGRIVADDGTIEQIAIGASPGDYYIVIKQRNHLAVMSAGSVPLSSASSTLYDFTSDISQFYGGGAKELAGGTGIWGMHGGNADNSDQDIFASDLASIKVDFLLGLFGYHLTDVDMDGDVFASDYALGKINFLLGAFSAVP